MEQEELERDRKRVNDLTATRCWPSRYAPRAARRASSRRGARSEAPADVFEGARRHRVRGRHRGRERDHRDDRCGVSRPRDPRRGIRRDPKGKRATAVTSGSSIRSTARLNFVHGFPYYAISIALVHGTDITHAVVLDPVHDELFTAVKGKGAQRNGAPIRVSAARAFDDALVGTVFPTRRARSCRATSPIFTSLAGQCGGMRRAGACALRPRARRAPDASTASG